MKKGKVLVVSIKPEFANKIFSGEKTIELRKATPNVQKGDIIIIYVTNPVKAFKGIGKVEEIVQGTPKVIWKNYSKSSGISKETFFDYYSNAYKAVGILLCDIQELESEISLNDIILHLPKFSPPQTFKYSSKAEIQKIINMSLF